MLTISHNTHAHPFFETFFQFRNKLHKRIGHSIQLYPCEHISSNKHRKTIGKHLKKKLSKKEENSMCCLKQLNKISFKMNKKKYVELYDIVYLYLLSRFETGSSCHSTSYPSNERLIKLNEGNHIT